MKNCPVEEINFLSLMVFCLLLLFTHLINDLQYSQHHCWRIHTERMLLLIKKGCDECTYIHLKVLYDDYKYSSSSIVLTKTFLIYSKMCVLQVFSRFTQEGMQSDIRVKKNLLERLEWTSLKLKHNIRPKRQCSALTLFFSSSCLLFLYSDLISSQVSLLTLLYKCICEKWG